MAIPLAVFVAVTAVYLPALNNGFIYDDNSVVLGPRTPRTLADVPGVFTSSHFGTELWPYYRPLVLSTYTVQLALHGEQAWAFHLFNALLLGGSACLAYATLRLPAFGVPRGAAALLSTVFGMHPLASSCAYAITSRETALTVLFMQLCVYAWLRPGRGWFAVSLISLGAALLCKEMAVVLPVLLVTADVLGLRAVAGERDRARRLRACLRYVPVVAITAGYFLVRRAMFGGSEYRLAVVDQPLGPVFSYLYALQAIVAPTSQLVYEPDLRVWWSGLRVVVAVLCTAAVVVAAWRSARERRAAILFWLAWLALVSLPTANLLHQETQFAERYVYAALLGWLGVAAVAVRDHWQAGPRRRAMATAALVGMVVICGTLSVARARYFHDDLAFSSQWLATNPGSAQAYSNLGDIYARRGETDVAIRHYEAATKLRPDFFQVHNNLANLLEREGDFDGARRRYELAIAARPQHAHAHYNLGRAWAARGQFDRAEAHYLDAIAERPDFAAAYYSLGLLARARAKRDPASADRFLDQAQQRFTTALTHEPDFVPARAALAQVLALRGGLPAAVAHFREAVRLEPGNAALRGDLAKALAQQGAYNDSLAVLRPVDDDPQAARAMNDLGARMIAAGHHREGRSLLERAVQLQPDFCDAHVNLGQFHAGAGEPERAIGHFETAVRLNPRDALGRWMLAQALVDVDRSRDAVAQLETALELLPPESEAARRVQADLERYTGSP